MPTLTTIQGHLYNAQGVVVTEGIFYITLQSDMVSVDGTKVAPFTVTVDLSLTAGYVDVDLYATVGASPAGLAYQVEFDPDPDDTTRPRRNKEGYFRNYWSVPNTGSVSLGSFTNAERGQPFANYMPVGGTVSAFSDSVTLGTGSTTNKRIIANQATASDPEIRFNNTTGQWEFSDDGTTFQSLLQGGGGSVGGDLSGTVGSATVIKIRGSAVSATAPTTTGQVLRWNTSTSQYEPSLDGSQFTGLNATNITTGTLPLARLSNITNTEISATAAIAWSKISKVGANIADLGGSLSIVNADISAAAAIDATKIADGSVTNTEFQKINNLDQQLATTNTPQFTRLGLGGAADSSAALKITGQYYAALYDAGTSGTAKTIDWNNSNAQILSMTGNCTVTLNNPKDGGRYVLILTQDGIGGRSMTWPATVLWSNNAAPSLTPSPGKSDLVVVMYSATLGKYLATMTSNF